jgi:uncharacterized repeat protein (TIGR01451 family)
MGRASRAGSCLVLLALSAIAAHAQDADPAYHWLPLRDPSPADWVPPPQWEAARRDYYLFPCCDVNSVPVDPCTDSWTSGGYRNLGEPSSWTPDLRPTWNDPPVWLHISIDLSEYADRAVAIGFLFRANDDRYNAHEGVYVDNIRLGPLARQEGDAPAFFVNGADSVPERERMLVFGNQEAPHSSPVAGPTWHRTRRRASPEHGEWRWWFGHEASGGSYQGYPDPDPSTCRDSEARGMLMTPVMELAAGAPRLEFDLLFRVQGGALWQNSVYPVDAFQVALLVDTDRDGLLDAWEMGGVDLDLDGTGDLILPGANPLHKNMYVELDCMPGTGCDLPGVTNQVREAFANIPISNPDGATGIDLFIDDGGVVPDDPYPHSFVDGSFDLLKILNFDLDRRCCFHYGAWVQALSGGALGRAEIGGNDFMLAMPANSSPEFTAQDQATALMHELGHNLDLRHGGSHDTNFKPHYFSTMNYRYLDPGTLPGGQLRFSSESMPFLYEHELRESMGLGALVPFPSHPFTFACNSSGSPGGTALAGDQPIDWDCDGTASANHTLLTCADLNGDGLPTDCAQRKLEEFLDTFMTSHSDVHRIRLLFGESTDYADGVHTRLTPMEDEMTRPLHLKLRGDPGADVTAPQVVIADVSPGPSGRPASSIQITDPQPSSGLREVRLSGPNVVEARTIHPSDPALASASIVVESTDDRPPRFSLVTDDWARNAVGRSHGFPPDVLPPRCELAARLLDPSGALVLEVLVRDDNHISRIDPVLHNASYPEPGGGAGRERFVRVDPALPMLVELSAADASGNTTSCAFTQDSAIVDADVDGVTDAIDNCPLQANSSQEDVDGDGVGDACLAVLAPELEGVHQTDAVAALAAALLRIGAVTNVNSATVPEGSVVAQHPRGGRTVAEGTAVDLAVSLGPVQRVVPSVVGLAQSDAEAALIAASLGVGAVGTTNDPSIPAGTVVSQQPVGGTSVAEGSPVDLVVSSGPALVSVPPLAGLTQGQAEAQATGAGLVVGSVTTAHSATVAPGYVLSQHPPAGSSVAPGSVVDLVVSLGAELVTVPNAVGSTPAAAASALQAAGLGVGSVTTLHHATVPAGIVLGQSPAAGAPVGVGSAVDLVVSAGPQPVPVPNVTGATETAAVAAVLASGLTVGSVLPLDSPAPIGQVLDQTPAPGAMVAPGAAVDLVISRGLVVLSVALTGPTSAQRGQTLEYVLAYGNQGTRTSPDAVLRDTLPSTVVFQSASAGGTYDPSTRQVSWSLGPLAAGSSGQARITVTVTCSAVSFANATYSLQAGPSVRTGPPATTTVVPATVGPIAVAVTSEPARLPLQAGDLVTHTVTLTNATNEQRAGLRVPMGAGAGMDFDAVVDAGGGTFHATHPTDALEWNGALTPLGSVAFAFRTRVESTIPAGVDEAALHDGQQVQVVSCGGSQGSATAPSLALLRPVRARVAATSLGGPQSAPSPFWGVDHVLMRPEAAVELQLTLSNQVAHDEPAVTARLALPAGLTAAGDPPFLPPTDPGATYEVATRTVTWSGAIAAGDTRTVTLRVQVGWDAGCRAELALLGTTSGEQQDIRARTQLHFVPEPPATPYLVGLDPSGADMGLWTLGPTGQERLLCVDGEGFTRLARAAGGVVYVSGLPSFRLNPATLELAFLPQGAVLDVEQDTTSAPATDVFSAPGRIWRVVASGAEVTIAHDPSLMLGRLAIDRLGRVLGLRPQTGLTRIDPNGILPVPVDQHEAIATGVTLPYAAQLGELASQEPIDVGIAADGGYLVTVRSIFRQNGVPPAFVLHIVDSLVRIDPTTLARTVVAHTVAAYSQGVGMPDPPPPPFLQPLLGLRLPGSGPMALGFGSAAVSPDGEAYYGMRGPGSLGVVRLQPSVAGEMLVPPSASAADAADLEWIAPAAPTDPQCAVAWDLRTMSGGWAAFVVQGAGLPGTFAFSGNGEYIEAASFTSFVVSADGDRATFSGTGSGGRTFAVEIEDRSTSGVDDRFRLWIDGVLQTTADGALTGGNVTIAAAH